MPKSFVELKYRRRVFRLRANDIAKVFKVPRRNAPVIPSFQTNCKPIPETDIDNEVQEVVQG